MKENKYFIVIVMSTKDQGNFEIFTAKSSMEEAIKEVEKYRGPGFVRFEIYKGQRVK